MRKLALFLENPFDARGISLAELVGFSTDHLQRMSANNAGGELNARIAATTSALTLLGDTVTDDQGLLGIRMARKQTKDDFRTNTVPGMVARIEGGITSALGAGSSVHTEALPMGRSIFTNCRDDQLATHLETLLNAVTTHQASLSAATVSQASNLLSTWNTIYQNSEAATGNKTTSEAEKRLARENLQLMLYLNLVKLMEMFPRQPEKLPLYMMQHLLENPESPDEEEEEPPPPTPPGP
ncbi:MAG: hypothetical protein JNJ83_13160 [Verrucomicrobiaceae bacterium]|nr:hypothetical protein [Verrucomicrobiaceae bacterium]